MSNTRFNADKRDYARWQVKRMLCGRPTGADGEKKKNICRKKSNQKNQLNFRARTKKHFTIGMFNEKKYHIIKYVYIFTLGFICKKDPASGNSIDNS